MNQYLQDKFSRILKNILSDVADLLSKTDGMFGDS